MSQSNKIAVVTGANKGIGLATVELLAKDYKDWIVYLTARDETRGKAAVESLKAKHLANARFHLLDVKSGESAHELARHLKETYGGIDVLVNNAAIFYGYASTIPFDEQAKSNIETNYFGILNVCQALFPLLRKHARVVHVSSMGGPMTLSGCSEDLKKEITAKDLTLERLNELMQSFVDSAREGKHKENGWPTNAYGVSKIGVTALAGVHQRQFDNNRPQDDILVNACCPGMVDTDMTFDFKSDEKLTIYEGARTPIYLATLEPNTASPRGDMVQECRITGWQAYYPENVQRVLDEQMDKEALAKGDFNFKEQAK